MGMEGSSLALHIEAPSVKLFLADGSTSHLWPLHVQPHFYYLLWLWNLPNLKWKPPSRDQANKPTALQPFLLLPHQKWPLPPRSHRSLHLPQSLSTLCLTVSSSLTSSSFFKTKSLCSHILFRYTPLKCLNIKFLQNVFWTFIKKKMLTQQTLKHLICSRWYIS